MKTKSFRLILAAALSLLFLLLSCQKDPPIVPPGTPSTAVALTLSSVEVQTDRVTLALSVTRPDPSPIKILLKRDSLQVMAFFLVGGDTLLTDTTVEANTVYSYCAFAGQDSIYRDSSNALPVRTVADTTKPEITLSLLDAGYTSASIRVQTVRPKSIRPAKIILLRDTVPVLTVTLAGRDTVITAAGLEYNTSYSFSALMMKDSVFQDSSNTVNVKTLADTIKPSITLSVFDAGLIDVSLKIHTIRPRPLTPVRITLLKDGNAYSEYLLAGLDTVLVDTNVTPNGSYNYQIQLKRDAQIIASSGTLPVQTMKTTNYSFTYETFTFPGVASAVLRDVAIINDSCIWAVGDFELPGDDLRYNAYYYNGKTWEPKRIQFQAEWGSTITLPLTGIFSFSSEDIWVMGDGWPIHGNGASWMYYRIMEINTTNGWGLNSNDMYFCGYDGNLYHYNGVKWIKINAGTGTNISDVYGAVDPMTGQKMVLCCVTNKWESGDRKLLTIRPDDTVDSIRWTPNRAIGSVWFRDPRHIFTAGAGVYVKNIGRDWKLANGTPIIFTHKIRGQNDNDVFAVGDWGVVLHFNGETWHEYKELSSGDLWYSCDYKGNLMVAVGTDGWKARILMMRRH